VYYVISPKYVSYCKIINRQALSDLVEHSLRYIKHLILCDLNVHARVLIMFGRDLIVDLRLVLFVI
jgi:hypothetical protein